MNWDDVRVFAVVANCKSITKAAHVLKVTPGMVSRRLEELEAALQARLFTRTSAGMVLTPTGEDMLDRALSMQRFAESIEETVRARDNREEGMVTVRAPDGIGGYWVAPRLATFLNENPKIRITLDCGTLTADMGADADIIITADKADAHMGDAVDTIATLHYVMVAAPSYLETFGTPKSIASAAGDFRTLKHVGQKNQRESWDPRASAVDALASWSFVTNSSTALLAAALTGAGICAAPTVMCQLYPGLQIVGAEAAFPIQLWIIVRREVQHSARVRRVAEWLRGVFDTKINPWFRNEFVPPSRFTEELAAIRGRLAPAAVPTGRAAPRRRRGPEG
jgi:DNA-binding transcriptional LysR family regulator